MSGLELAALLPLLILVGGSCLVLMMATFDVERQALIGTGIACALLAAVFAGIGPVKVDVVGGMFSTGGYARFFIILWALTAAITLMLSSRWGNDDDFPAGEYTSLVLFASTGMGMLVNSSSVTRTSLETLTCRN